MIEKLHGDIVFWLQQMGTFVKSCMQENISVTTKTSLSDIVTNIDCEIEEKFIHYIHTHYPSHSVLGEESASHFKAYNQGYVWIIDPIDGTLNFVKEQKNFAIMIALYIDGVGQLGYIFDVMNDTLYYAIKGQGAYCNNHKLNKPDDLDLKHSLISLSSCFIVQEHSSPYRHVMTNAQGIRMIGSASHSMLAIFNNHYHAYISAKLRPWDFLAGLVIADELGIVYSTADGSPLPLWEPTSLVIGTPHIHHEIISSYKVN
ncbi:MULTISPECIES: inositol monophosphatase family protein [unclassified Granulicatella]|uniref:inositol monophosphatase family protein n=1 Tax=unclassified Granulicatella TaxID=2630493 RepID=UPI001073D669|nr:MULTISPECIES: inositol monophosphatase family protein [unclassified Granulicatella]MBF0780320.1 inositol monophosphatase family protein [Granulicatella sp. 19428wC4_WM01]TFU95547.1 inositol monophosphatase family protein [Granulicatella sp. WM01]